MPTVGSSSAGTSRCSARRPTTPSRSGWPTSAGLTTRPSRPCRPFTPATSGSSRGHDASTGSSPTSTARSTGASTPRCAWPTTWLVSTASSNGSSSWPTPTRSSSGPPWPPPFPALADTPMTFSAAPPIPTLDRVPYADVSIATLWVTAYSVARFAEHAAQVLPDPGFRAAVLPGGHQLRPHRGGLPPRPVRAVQHPAPARPLPPRVRGDRWGVHARRRRLRLPCPRAPAVAPRGPDHRVRVRPPRALAQLLGAGLAGSRPAQGASTATMSASSPPVRGPDPTTWAGASSTSGCSTTATPGSSIAAAMSAWLSPCRPIRPTCRIELMACGVPVIAFDNPAGDWILEHDRNSLRCRRTVDGLARGPESPGRRRRPARTTGRRSGGDHRRTLLRRGTPRSRACTTSSLTPTVGSVRPGGRTR